MEKKTIKQQRGFACIASPDERYRIWIPRPTPTGILVCTCGFSLSGHMDFVDAVDRLFYVRVDRAQTIDDDLSNLYLTCLQAPWAAWNSCLWTCPTSWRNTLGN